MTYSDFVDTLSSGFSMFYNALITLSNSLINNYIIITMLGIPIFFSLVYLIGRFLAFTRDYKSDLDNVRGDKK